MTRHRSTAAPITTALAAVLIIVLTLGAYVASYLALLDPDENRLTISLTGARLHRRAEFRFGGSLAEVLFLPANRIDQWVRPAYWDGPVVPRLDDQVSFAPGSTNRIPLAAHPMSEEPSSDPEGSTRELPQLPELIHP